MNLRREDQVELASILDLTMTGFHRWARSKSALVECPGCGALLGREEDCWPCHLEGIDGGES